MAAKFFVIVALCLATPALAARQNTYSGVMTLNETMESPPPPRFETISWRIRIDTILEDGGTFADGNHGLHIDVFGVNTRVDDIEFGVVFTNRTTINAQKERHYSVPAFGDATSLLVPACVMASLDMEYIVIYIGESPTSFTSNDVVGINANAVPDNCDIFTYTGFCSGSKYEGEACTYGNTNTSDPTYIPNTNCSYPRAKCDDVIELEQWSKRFFACSIENLDSSIVIAPCDGSSGNGECVNFTKEECREKCTDELCSAITYNEGVCRTLKVQLDNAIELGFAQVPCKVGNPGTEWFDRLSCTTTDAYPVDEETGLPTFGRQCPGECVCTDLEPLTLEPRKWHFYDYEETFETGQYVAFSARSADPLLPLSVQDLYIHVSYIEGEFPNFQGSSVAIAGQASIKWVVGVYNPGTNPISYGLVRTLSPTTCGVAHNWACRSDFNGTPNDVDCQDVDYLTCGKIPYFVLEPDQVNRDVKDLLLGLGNTDEAAESECDKNAYLTYACYHLFKPCDPITGFLEPVCTNELCPLMGGCIIDGLPVSFSPTQCIDDLDNQNDALDFNNDSFTCMGFDKLRSTGQSMVVSWVAVILALLCAV